MTVTTPRGNYVIGSTNQGLVQSQDPVPTPVNQAQ